MLCSGTQCLIYSRHSKVVVEWMNKGIHGLVTKKWYLWKSLCIYKRLFKNSFVDNRVVHTLAISVKKIESWQRNWGTGRFINSAKRQVWGWGSGLLSPSLGLFPGRWKREPRNATFFPSLIFSFLLPWSSSVLTSYRCRKEKGDTCLVLSFWKESGHQRAELLRTQDSEPHLPGAWSWWQFPTGW